MRLVYDGPFTLVNARGGHWWQNSGEDAAIRAWAGRETRRLGTIFRGPVKVEALMTTDAKGGRLADPAAIFHVVKHIVDGVVDGGALRDDGGDCVISETYYPPERTDTRSVIVMITEV